MKLKTKIQLFGYLQSIGMSAVLFYTFIRAYINDNQTLVRINTYGEAQVELIILIVLFPVICIGFILLLMDVKKR